MKLLVHICCADCGLKLVESAISELKLNATEIFLYFYNPNIHPESEWHARKNAVKSIAQKLNLDLRIATWEPKDFFNALRDDAKLGQLSGYIGKQIRCPVCWELRLRKTFEYGKEQDFEYISSTLFSSIYHNQEMIKKIAQNLENEYKIKVFIPKKVNYCLKTGGFYKQNYEGCIYSLFAKYTTKYLETDIG